MKHFVVELTYKIPAEEIGEVLAEHRAYLKLGYSKGWLLFSGPKVPKTGGVIVARAPSLEELRLFFNTDPYFMKDIAEYRFIEFYPVLRQDWMENWVVS